MDAMGANRGAGGLGAGSGRADTSWPSIFSIAPQRRKRDWIGGGAAAVASSDGRPNHIRASQAQTRRMGCVCDSVDCRINRGGILAIRGFLFSFGRFYPAEAGEIVLVQLPWPICHGWRRRLLSTLHSLLHEIGRAHV